MNARSRIPMSADIVALVVLTTLAAVAAGVALGFPTRARIYPLVVASTALLLALTSLVITRHRNSQQPLGNSDGKTSFLDDTKRVGVYAAWFIGYYGMTACVGLATASGVFVATFLAKKASLTWRNAIIIGTLVVITIAALGMTLNLRWPASLIDPLSMMGLLN